METFAPGDRVFAINTDHSRAICDPTGAPLGDFAFPDGLLRQRLIYHVESVQELINGHQGIFLTGMRVTLRGAEIPWDSSRFRKVEIRRDHALHKRRRMQPAAYVQFH